ncbi:MAG: hypothetical protein HN390_08795 [Anaerolineae bacterium]|jgi:hypothetical protein|nr:hypothetical protein [Anaerolineae bacterium]
MMKSVKVFLGLVIALSLLAVVPAQADGGDSHFFSQTKHNVQGDFWAYYQNIKEAESVLGYPITEEFVNRDGVLVQYFQRARLEMQKGQVHLTPLGVLLYRPGVQLDIVNDSACTKHETGFSVCFAFRDYFNAHLGTGLLGLPISPFEFQDNMIVQYFQNGRLEWHPSNPDDQRVVTGNLGSAYFNAIGEDPARLTGVESDNGIAEILSLNVRAFPWKAVTYSTDQQLIFVVVQDQTLQAVQGASGEAIVKWTSGATQSLDITTDEKGIATLSLPVNNQAYGGLVTVDVNITYGNLRGETTTSFRIWY